MTEINTTAHEQRGICRHCGHVVTRQSGEVEWKDSFTASECWPRVPTSEDDEIEPGVHEPITVVDRPVEQQSTSMDPTALLHPAVPMIPRFAPPKS